MSGGRRTGNKPWKHIYGTDRKYTRRLDRLAERSARPFRDEEIRALVRDTIERHGDALQALGDE